MAALSVILSHWYYNFEDLQLSSNDFYTSLETLLKERTYPGVSAKRVTHSEGGMFSAGREYLQITRGDYVFDICAAPFGKSFFISWWLGEKGSFLADLLARIPFIGAFLARKALQKTYFQIDTENMFREAISQALLSIIDAILEKKGLRVLTGQERKPIDAAKAA